MIFTFFSGSRISALPELFWSLFFVCLISLSAAHAAPSPYPVRPSGVPLFPPRSPAIPTHLPSPSSIPSVPPLLTASEAKRLQSEFTRAQTSEMAGLKRQQQSELKELKASQAAQLKEWENKERDARHKFFADHKKGPERRALIQDYLERRKMFLQFQADEKSRRTNSQDVRMESLKQDQAQRLKEFQEHLKRGERP